MWPHTACFASAKVKSSSDCLGTALAVRRPDMQRRSALPLQDYIYRFSPLVLEECAALMLRGNEEGIQSEPYQAVCASHKMVRHFGALLCFACCCVCAHARFCYGISLKGKGQGCETRTQLMERCLQLQTAVKVHNELRALHEHEDVCTERGLPAGAAGCASCCV